MAVRIVEVYSVSPSEGAVAEQSLPLVYFDMIWLPFHPTESLNFYDYKCSEPYFMETIVVKLKHSLTIALKNFLPLAGKIIFPLRSAAMPVSRYSSAAGDSVAVTIAVSDADFANMTGNHSKAADEFHHLVPQLPPAIYSSDEIKFSAVAIQVTLFPNQGISIGFTHHHAVCDATSLFAFVQEWASINKLNGGEQLRENDRPFHGRSCVQDANRLDPIIWNLMKRSRPAVSLTISFPLNKFRATFNLSKPQIEKLTKFAVINKPSTARVSTFVVVCAYIWSCLAKSAVEAVPDDELEYLAIPMDARARLNPPLPGTYFGNCLTFCWADSAHGRLKGNDGFIVAVDAIAAAISGIVDKGVLDDFEIEAGRDPQEIGKRVVTVAGSLRIDHYGADYGWGRAVKYECVHIDLDGAVSLCKGRDGGVEIGLSMPMAEMGAFSPVFHTNLHIIKSNL